MTPRQSFPTPQIHWSAKGGEISSEGIFAAGDTGGLYTIHARAQAIEAVAEVRVITETAPGPTPGAELPKGKRLVRWRGTVPPQKWMNLYTKVLTRFASSSELKLEVAFDVPLTAEEAQSKAEDARSGLKELGLDDEIQCS